MNISLTWMPWSWKSNLWRKLAEYKNMNFLDIDDYMEEINNKTVWEILREKWEEKFLDYEEEIIQSLKPNNTIISCSWSIPLKENAMKHLSDISTIIYINIPLKTILNRLNRMKVDRIVWMWTMNMEEILEYRESFYLKNYHYMFENEWIWTKDEVFEDFLNFIKSNNIF